MTTATTSAAPSRRFVSYIRVSTAKQGQSGLGLEAQREACRAHMASIQGATHIGEHVEVESGKRDDRPQLAAAIAEARAYGATLLIAKLDRLSRDAHFLLGLDKAGIEFVCCDNPQANKLTIGVLAIVAQHEREAISARTKAALAAAKARGTRLGNPKGAAHLKGRGNREAVSALKTVATGNASRIAPVLAKLKAEGVTTANGLARALNERSVPAPRGGTWTARSVLNIASRLEGATPG
jgi:DNA invertase Pin-like site-specific DNA recombinase